MQIRLNKYLASAGIGSRRECDTIISSGKISIDNEIRTDLGIKIDPDKHIIKYNGKTVKVKQFEYYILNKPVGYVVSRNGQNSKTVYDIFKKNIPYVGRLDKDSSGLLFFTNNGELANKLTHPKYHIPKTYHITLNKEPNSLELNKLRNGILLSDGKTAPAEIGVKGKNVYMVLHEGKKRQIRRMFEAVGIRVIKLHREKFGAIELKRLPVGKWRKLDTKEIGFLMQNTGTIK